MHQKLILPSKKRDETTFVLKCSNCPRQSVWVGLGGEEANSFRLVLPLSHSFSFYRTRIRSLLGLVTHSDWWLTHSLLLLKLDRCDSALPKPIDTVTVADVDTEELVDNSLVVILKLNFGQDIKAEVRSRFEEKILWGWDLIMFLKL